MEGMQYMLTPWRHWDRVQLTICGHLAFQCRLTHLKFNMKYEMDPICQRAIAAAKDMSLRLQDAEKVRLSKIKKQSEFAVCNFKFVNFSNHNIH